MPNLWGKHLTSTEHVYLTGDCLDLLLAMPENSVDLVLCSPPYENARKYGELGFALQGQEWVDWCLPRYLECVKVSKGLVAWVVEGRTRNFQWSATPSLLEADLHRAGVKLRHPLAFHRVGISGSGGPDWLRNDHERIVCSSKGKLPWSDNTAMGHPPKYKPGGAMTHQTVNGRKVAKKHTKSRADGTMEVQGYNPPAIANPGNVIRCKVGKGNMGHKLCHENEAPFPEDLAEFIIRSFCPPGGTVLDCFGGSGTTSCVAKKWGRNSISIDLRESQRQIWEQRLKDPRYQQETT